jgi:hypothetical protein
MSISGFGGWIGFPCHLGNKSFEVSDIQSPVRNSHTTIIHDHVTPPATRCQDCVKSYVAWSESLRDLLSLME